MTQMDLDNHAALQASRRKMQAWRGFKNKIAIILSLLTMAFGLFWLVWILWTTISRGIGGLNIDLFTQMTPRQTPMVVASLMPWREVAY